MAPSGPEVVAFVYSLIDRARLSGQRPTGVVLPKAWHGAVQRYRAELGELPDGQRDYLGRYELFGLPVLTDICDEARLWYGPTE